MLTNPRSTPAPGSPGRVRRLWPALGAAARRPRVAMAVKAAVAAAFAWLAVQPIGGVVDKYPYYAPFGAVVVVSTTLATSARTAVQSVLAIVLGAGVAVALEAWLGRGAATVALVVALGTILGGWRLLGPMASYVPVSGLFVLILGAADPGQYVLAFAGLTALGAAIGVGMNLVFPPLPLGAAQESLDRLRNTLADQLDGLADALLAERPVSGTDWESHHEAVERAGAETRETVQHAVEAQRGNWRAYRWRDQAQGQYRAALTLEQLPFLVQDVTAILMHETGSRESVPWGAPLRPRMAHALQAAADLLRSVESSGAGTEELAGFDEALARLVDETRDARAASDDDLFGVAGVIVALRRLRASVHPRET
jgi:uncharacterized membrane protein YgaE (UPF0421/DUF939 family)